MDINRLHEFVALAESLNYTTTAKKLNLSQPSLSRHIGELEQSLGVMLFSRNEQLKLTYCGEILLEEASSLFAIEERLKARLRASKQADQECIRLEDYFFSRKLKNLFLQGIQAYRKTHPGINFDFIPVKHNLSIRDSVDNGYFDVGVLVHCGSMRPDFSQDADYDIIPLYFLQSKMGIYLHRSSLSEEQWNQEQITIEVLKDLPIVLPLRPEYANFKNDMIDLCANYSFVANFKLVAMASLESLAMVDMIGCAQIILESDLDELSSLFFLNGDCKFFHLEQDHFATPYLLWKKERSQALFDFYGTLESIVQNENESAFKSQEHGPM